MTINQHVFPRSAIERFTDSNGHVKVHRLSDAVPIQVEPKNPLFCALRAWDQKTETVGSRDIESRYAELADRIVRGEVRRLTPEMDLVVTDFYLLWCHRHIAKVSPLPEVAYRLMSPERQLSQEQEEHLEKNGVMFMRGQTMPSRFLNGMMLLVGMDRSRVQMQGAHWGLVRSDHAEFVVPDNALAIQAVPVAPRICLCRNLPDILIGAQGVGRMNRALVQSVAAYYFARDLERCPIYRRTLPWSPEVELIRGELDL